MSRPGDHTSSSSDAPPGSSTVGLSTSTNASSSNKNPKEISKRAKTSLLTSDFNDQKDHEENNKAKRPRPARTKEKMWTETISPIIEKLDLISMEKQTILRSMVEKIIFDNNIVCARIDHTHTKCLQYTIRLEKVCIKNSRNLEITFRCIFQNKDVLDILVSNSFCDMFWSMSIMRVSGFNDLTKTQSLNVDNMTSCLSYILMTITGTLGQCIVNAIILLNVVTFHLFLFYSFF